MARYIDATGLYEKVYELEQIARDKVKNTSTDNPRYNEYLALVTERVMFRKTILETPTENVKPIITGEWQGYVCSICGVSSEYGSEDFCPSCGAAMRKEVE